jgi:hypothetical protein
MLVSCHKTRSIFDRYHLVSEEDLKKAAERLATRHQQRMVRSTLTMRPPSASMRDANHMSSTIDLVGAGGRTRADTEG